MTREEATLRLLLVTDSYPPFVGGADRQVQRIAYAMRDRGHEVWVVTPWQPGLAAREDDAGVTVCRPRSLASRVTWFSRDPSRRHHPPLPDPGTMRGVREAVRELRPDVVHSYGWVTYSVGAALWRSTIPVLVSARDYSHICPVRNYLHVSGQVCSGPAPVKCLGCAVATYTLDDAGNAVLGRTDLPTTLRNRVKGAAKGTLATVAVIAGRPLVLHRMRGLHSVSAFVRTVMERHLLGDSAGTVPHEVIPSFLDEDPRDAPDPAVLARMPTEPYILFVGALLPGKGIYQLLDAYASLGPDRPPLALLGPAIHSSPTSLPEGAIWLGSVTHATVLAAWDGALFGVVPSVGAETFGSVVTEAMSRGRPVIASRLGGIVDIIRHGTDGLLVPPGDVPELARAMRTLLADPDRRRMMGDAARVRAEDFRAERVLSRFEALYRRVAAAPR